MLNQSIGHRVETLFVRNMSTLGFVSVFSLSRPHIPGLPSSFSKKALSAIVEQYQKLQAQSNKWHITSVLT